jgi:hypothetical protein
MPLPREVGEEVSGRRPSKVAPEPVRLAALTPVED